MRQVFIFFAKDFFMRALKLRNSTIFDHDIVERLLIAMRISPVFIVHVCLQHDMSCALL